MKTAGGVVALIAGIFGTLAAIVTLSVGGIGTAFEAKEAETVVNLGFGGLFFSFVTIVLGAVGIAAKGALPGMLLILSSILGAVLGGTLVAVCMALALVGGILIVFGR